ncbi:Stk1 family PASTA domain-containing Ser/Thr kinase [Janibacter sp. UYMM211]|uniref:Stk1 family PASTA domain-containing Ser/Thr kinase n=1 Tax=Janibacter sp. UYMM211 TaxID=3156342 RepID=UPI003393EAAA
MGARSGVEDLVGITLDGRYRVLEHLADGGMASVYRGLDTRLERDVAIKVMRPDLAADDTFVSRFRREARSAARLAHPHVVGVHDQGESDGLVFLVMEHVPGQTLREVLRTEGALSPRAALDLLEPVLAGLAAAHDAGLVHRDVKPENVLIRDDGTVKVADFGLARAVSSQTATGTTGVLLGTVSYLSPEQVERGIADPRSDVYAAGLLLFEMLTGRKAVDGETPIHVAFQHVHGDLPSLRTTRPDVPVALDELVAAAVARDPDERPRDASTYLGLVTRVRRQLGDAELDARPAPGSAHERSTRSDETALLDATAGGSRRPDVVGARAERSGATEATRTSPTTATDLATGPQDPPARRRSPFALIGLALLVAALAGGLWWGTLGQRTTVPEVAGADASTVEARLTGADLRLSTKQAFDEDVAPGVAIGSTPAAGQEGRRGDEVVVTFSKGPERYEVPYLTRLTKDAASARLARDHLVVGSTTSEHHESVPQGQVIRTDPTTGTKMRRDAKVALVLSKGPQPVAIPSVTGQPYESAKTTLEEAGFVVERAADVNDQSVPKGSVVSQDPASGGTGVRGDTVTLAVSKGPVMVTIPDVEGKSETDATTALEGAGLAVKVQRFFGSPLDQVRATSPRAGTSVPKGSTVTILVV